MADSSLLFIPDISGFTQFVHSTEIEHSQHIIAELLELLIDTDSLGLIVSEIEGDAVLFYKQQELPSAEQLLTQAQKMFVAFHNHLVQYEKQRICDCGACSTASRLSLKIVAHRGEFGIIKVKDFRKPYGSDVILAHRLLKNEIDVSEYLLMTPGLLAGEKQGDLSLTFPWAKFHEGVSDYDALGEILYTYVPLAPLHKQVQTSADLPRFERMPNPLVKEIFIDCPVEKVFDWVTDLQVRSRWNVGVKEVIYPESRVNRVGTSHTCVLPVGTLRFETIAAEKQAARRVYAERIIDAWFAQEMMQYIEMESKGVGTHVRFEIHYRLRPFFRILAGSMLRSRLANGAQKSLEALKVLCEEA